MWTIANHFFFAAFLFLWTAWTSMKKYVSRYKRGLKADLNLFWHIAGSIPPYRSRLHCNMQLSDPYGLASAFVVAPTATGYFCDGFRTLLWASKGNNQSRWMALKGSLEYYSMKAHDIWVLMWRLRWHYIQHYTYSALTWRYPWLFFFFFFWKVPDFGSKALQWQKGKVRLTYFRFN